MLIGNELVPRYSTCFVCVVSSSVRFLRVANAIDHCASYAAKTTRSTS
ncbi:unnamed protein product [Amoebophrya sp. A25]|nr:unnamed protein product [Amoebophrya sp. A25]|eukprot:GSA25T00018079001.1